MIVARTAELAEEYLDADTMICSQCRGRLIRWGYGRTRTIRSHGRTTVTVRPRRVRCTDCHNTHIVLPAAFTARRADTTAVIGEALSHKANGIGYRRIAELLDRPAATVRRWLARATPHHLRWMWQQGVSRLIMVNRKAYSGLAFSADGVRNALLALCAAAYWDRHRFGFPESPWTLIGIYTRGRLLAPPR
ncbi:DUF6431 domain-containing protein [Mycobacterium sp. smrl_JER01]|uniref:DUF6431 domain-containing protein n=1 Tax=Mycobacterium sp. smrl_JER01 TaxID=3402633 RepID=UPI003AD09933